MDQETENVIYRAIMRDEAAIEEAANVELEPKIKEIEDEEKVNDLFRAGKKMLYKIKTFFPFDLFPDDLTIDPIKVNHVHRVFFFTEQVNTYILENIKSVTMENFLIFSKLIFFDDKTINTGVVIGPFFKKDALKAYNIIQGLIASLKRKVDVTRIKVDKDIDKIAQIGMALPS